MTGTSPMQDSVLTVAGAARLLNVSHDTIYRLARDAEIPGRKVGNQWRFSKAALFAWLRHGAAANPASRHNQQAINGGADSIHGEREMNGEVGRP